MLDLTAKSTLAIGPGQTLKGKGTVLLGENTTVPEPSGIALAGLGLAAAAFASRRRREARKQGHSSRG